MKGLIIKDLKLSARALTRSILLIYALLLVYLAYATKEASGFVISVMLGMGIGMSVMTTISLDEASGWFKQERLLPLSIRQRVGSKYLLLIALLVPASLLVVLVAAIVPLIFPAASFSNVALMLTALWCLTLIYNAISIPVTYRFGSKSRMITILLLVFPSTFLMSYMQSDALLPLLAGLPFSLPVMMACFVAIALLLYLISFPIGCKLYKRFID